MGSVSHSSSSSTPDSRFEKVAKMDSIRKKMQSMKADTDEMYAKIQDYENVIKETNNDSDKFDNDIRDTGKRVQKLETGLEEIMEKLQASNSKMEEAEAEFKDKEDDVNAQSRRVLLLEEECRISVEKLATTVYKLALMSKDADNIIKNCRQWENNTSNNEMEIEQLDNNTRAAKKIGSDNEMKYDNLARSLSMMNLVQLVRIRNSSRCPWKRRGGGRRSIRSR